MEKSQAIFKLQTTKAMLDMGKLTDRELIDRLEIYVGGNGRRSWRVSKIPRL